MADVPIYLDFETDEIQARPSYPPRPVGVSLRWPKERKSRYLAWGHPTSNNCTETDAKHALQDVWSSGLPVAMHHAKFDLAVATEKMGMPMLPWGRIHDTMILAYLVDPHAKKLGLKELAASRLGLPPTERDEVHKWLIEHGIERQATKRWGRSISKAPGDLVGRYAAGDTDRTKLILESLLPEVQEAKMQEAYDRERRLVPVLLRNEQEGVAVDVKKLHDDVTLYDKALEKVDALLFKRLKCQPFNLNSDEELADSLDRVFPNLSWPLTPGGKRSTSKDSLAEVVGTLVPDLVALFTYRATISTCVNTFMRPWLEMAEATGGRIHTQWNSVAQSEGGGTRTGRLSSSPNFQNIPTLESAGFVRAIELWARYLEKLDFPPLPAVRSYIVADSKSEVLVDFDFSQQELRVLAHFEDGQLAEAYRQNPTMDLHEFAAKLVTEATGVPISRKASKTIAFGLLYGMGLGSLAERLGVTVDEARRAKKAYLDTFPGIDEIQDDLKFRGKNHLPMTTWGGRRYFAEPPRVINGIRRDFYYRLFNYLIQGSSADITKEAVLRYDDTRQHGRLLLTVHDQITISVPKKHWKAEAALLREAMQGVRLDVPLLADGGVGYRWTELQDF